MSKKVIFCFGRFNPPHIGTDKLFKFAKELAEKESATFKIYVSHTQDHKKNPLDYKNKIKFLKLSFPEYISNVSVSENHTIYDILKELSKNFSSAILVVGEDRVEEFQRAVKPYIDNPDNPDSIKLYNFKVISAGERDKNSPDRVERISGSLMRKYAQENNFEKFSAGAPEKLPKDKVKQLFTLVRTGMGLSEDINNVEVNSMSESNKTYDSFRQFFIKMMDEDTNRPDSDFLVVDKKSGERHLPVKKDGKADHHLMGAAYAALTKGFRGNKYEGPHKADALSKLKALYKSEKIDIPE